MVRNILALGRNGIQDWLYLRVTAVVILLYVIYFLNFVISDSIITYDIWRGFFSTYFTKVFTLLTLLSVLVHGWIGLWQVITDYIKLICLRMILQLASVIILLVYAIYGTALVWSA